MGNAGLYSDFAKYYDLIYEWKDYKKESETVHKLVKKFKKSTGNKLLDIACGTGNHIQFLKKHYRITGIDLNGQMLKIARKKFPKTRFFKADMKNFNLKKEFDAVVCLFSSIAYLKGYGDLEKAIKCFAKHLKKGGVLIIEPFVEKKAFKSGTMHAQFVNKPEVKIARINTNNRKGDKVILDFHYLIGTPKGIKYSKEKHAIFLFDAGNFLKILRKHGFKAKFLKNGLLKNRGLYVGVKK